MHRRTIIVGDVHGCADELDDLCCELGFDPTADVMVFVGDLIAKGPDSRGVLARARDWGARSVLGNHEDHLLSLRAADASTNAADGPPQGPHARLAAELSAEDFAQLEALPLWLQLEDALVVHAGLIPGVSLGEQRRQDLLCLRTLAGPGRGSSRPDAGPLWASQYQGPAFVFFGHHARAGLQRHPHALGLDTGCVYGRSLTAFVMHEGAGQEDARQTGTVVSVPARRAYAEPRPRAGTPGGAS